VLPRDTHGRGGWVLEGASGDPAREVNRLQRGSAGRDGRGAGGGGGQGGQGGGTLTLRDNLIPDPTRYKVEELVGGYGEIRGGGGGTRGSI